jgi:mono/diheme cytochrome c family protein
MHGYKTASYLWLGRITSVWLALGILAFVAGRLMADDLPAPWVAPEESRNVQNPISPTEQTLADAEEIYTANCMLCHGEKGKGDGPGSQSLPVKPGDLTNPKFLSADTDGSIFWKITTGRAPMPPWKANLSDADRWKLVGYIRKLGEDATKK